MQIKIFKGNKGLTLMGIIIALIFLGTLLFFSLPTYLGWITKSLAERALVTLYHDRDQLEGCVQAHPHNETICQTSMGLHADQYFHYSLVFPRSPDSTVVELAPRNGFPDWTLYAWSPDDANYFKDYIKLSRSGMYTTSPTFSCTAKGIYSSVC